MELSNHSLFAVGRLVRTGFLQETIKVGGHVWAYQPQGNALLLPLSRKMAEASNQVLPCLTSQSRSVERRNKLVQSLGNLVDVAELFRLTLAMEPLHIGTLYRHRVIFSRLKDLPRQWDDLATLWAHGSIKEADIPYNFPGAVHDAAEALTTFLREQQEEHHLDNPVTLDEIETSRRSENQQFGPLAGWFLEAIALPKSGKLGVYMATFPPIRVESFNAANALSPSALTG